MTCVVLELLHQIMNSYLHNYTYITCHTEETPIAICNSPINVQFPSLVSQMFLYDVHLRFVSDG